MIIQWDLAASVFQKWIFDGSTLLAQSNFAECPGLLKIEITGVIAGESSFVIGLRFSDDAISPARNLTIDLIGCTFFRTEPITPLAPVVLLATRTTGETISFSQ